MHGRGVKVHVFNDNEDALSKHKPVINKRQIIERDSDKMRARNDAWLILEKYRHYTLHLLEYNQKSREKSGCQSSACFN